MISLTAIPPSPSLSKYIKVHLFAEVANHDFHESLVTPRGFHALIIAYKKQKESNFINIDFAPGIQPPNPQDDGIFLIGHYTKSFKAYSRGEFSLLYTVFEPAGTVAFFGHGQHHFTNTFVDVDELSLGILMDLVREELSVVTTHAQRVQIVERMLTGLMSRNRKKVTHKFREVAEWIMRINGNVSVQKIADECGMSKRTLERKFTEVHGLSPKQYTKIVRFKSVVQYLQTQTQLPDWNSVLHHVNYFDQSHFIHDFREFTGKSPTDFLQMDRHLDDAFIDVLK